MKKVIALFLALMFLLSCVTVASAAFSDEQKIDAKFLEAVNAMAERKIIGGFEDGSFQPEGTLTRAQAAKILCVMLEGEEKANALTAEKSSFTDVAVSNWACKFVEYCAAKNIVSGTGKGKFNPNGKLTGAAFAKMLLVANGADASKFSGDGWAMQVQKSLREAGANYLVAASEDPIQRQAACQMAYNFLYNKETEKYMAENGYTEKTISFANGKNVLAKGGRSEVTAAGLVANFPADGVEFSLDFGGDLFLNYTTTTTQYVVAVIDGVRQDHFSILKNNTSSRLATRVKPGVHKVQILRDSEIDTTGATLTFTGITCYCKEETMQAGTAGKLLIESVGDSITAGCGTLGTPTSVSGAVNNAGSCSYGYLAAQLLGAEHALVCKGGIGITKPSGKVTPKDLYLNQNAFRSLEEPYDFSRKADVVVLALGANDPQTDDDSEFYNGMLELAKTVREKNGNDCKIIFMFNMMVVRHEETMNKLSADLGGAAKNYYTLKVSRGVSGTPNGVPATPKNTPHPSAEDQALNAKELADFIKTII